MKYIVFEGARNINIFEFKRRLINLNLDLYDLYTVELSVFPINYNLPSNYLYLNMDMAVVLKHLYFTFLNSEDLIDYDNKIKLLFDYLFQDLYLSIYKMKSI